MDLLVFSHLRWNFVFQRPQHLISRCARQQRVFFWEEPTIGDQAAFLEIRDENSHLRIVVPHLPSGLDTIETSRVQQCLLAELLSEFSIHDFVAWYYTPLALDFSRNFQPKVTVYDCMDELSGFRGAPQSLRAAEAELFQRADLVFTGGKSLYESKRRQHACVHCFPSSIDREFFGSARHIRSEMPDQADVPHPRLGYCGVIDERMDTALLAAVAKSRPDWHLIMLGPTVKIEQSELPKKPNIHYLGPQPYRLLPAYMAGWDVGLLPFARNDATRFISPTKTPEYLAAGLPAVSTSIADVVEPYGRLGLVHIASTADEFVRHCELAIETRNHPERLEEVDKHLSAMSWDLTWEQMNRLVHEVLSRSYEVRSAQFVVSSTTMAD